MPRKRRNNLKRKSQLIKVSYKPIIEVILLFNKYELRLERCQIETLTVTCISLKNTSCLPIFKPLLINIIIAVSSAKQAKAEKKAKRAKKDKNAPKKPMSAFFCYQ